MWARPAMLQLHSRCLSTAATVGFSAAVVFLAVGVLRALCCVEKFCVACSVGLKSPWFHFFNILLLIL